MKKLKFVFILLITFFYWSTTKAQVEFERVYGGTGYDNAYSVTQTYDKGYAVVGSTTSFGSGSTDAYLLKTDSMGVGKWQRTFGSINIDQAYSVKETSDSGLIVAGYTNSFGSGGYDVYIIKTDKNGATLWEKTYGGNNWDFGYSIQQTTDGGYVVAGGTYSYGNGNEDAYLLKLDFMGDTVWTRTYGGVNDEEAKSVKQTSDGGYILTGFTKSFGDSTGDIYTVKTDSSGDTMWTYKYMGALEDFSYDVIQSVYNKYIICGKTKSIGFGNYDGISIEISLTGTYLSNGVYGVTEEDGMHSLIESIGGRLAILGYTYSYGFGLGTDDYLLYIFNPYNGFHASTFGGTDMEEANCINNTKDGGYILCGKSNSYSLLDHIYLVKTDSNGVSTGTVVNVVTGLYESSIISQGKFIMYPNPANDKIILTIPHEMEDGYVIIRDVLGREYYRKEIQNSLQNLEIDSNFLKEGMYFISIESSNLISTKRIIIQH